MLQKILLVIMLLSSQGYTTTLLLGGDHEISILDSLSGNLKETFQQETGIISKEKISEIIGVKDNKILYRAGDCLYELNTSSQEGRKVFDPLRAIKELSSNKTQDCNAQEKSTKTLFPLIATLLIEDNLFFIPQDGYYGKDKREIGRFNLKTEKLEEFKSFFSLLEEPPLRPNLYWLFGLYEYEGKPYIHYPSQGHKKIENIKEVTSSTNLEKSMMTKPIVLPLGLKKNFVSVPNFIKITSEKIFLAATKEKLDQLNPIKSKIGFYSLSSLGTFKVVYKGEVWPSCIDTGEGIIYFIECQYMSRSLIGIEIVSETQISATTLKKCPPYILKFLLIDKKVFVLSKNMSNRKQIYLSIFDKESGDLLTQNETTATFLYRRY